jgi:hypothetical protein
MTLSSSESLWLRHLSGERLESWEEQRLLHFLQEDPDLKDSVLVDREMDGLLRTLARSRRRHDRFVREFPSLLAAERDRTRFMSRFRDRMKRETGSGRAARKTTTRHIPRIAPPRPAAAPGPRLAILAAGLIAGIAILAALFASASPSVPNAPLQAKRAAVEDTPSAAAPKPLDRPPFESAEATDSGIPQDRKPRRPPESRETAAPVGPPAGGTGRHETIPAIAVLDRIEGDVYIVTPKGVIPARFGHDMMPGQGITTVGPRSRAGVKFPDSTRFELEGDTIISELAEAHGKRVSVSQGSLSIQAARQPAGSPMEILTPATRITVVGTRFTVACDPDATRVEVEEGRVRMDRPSKEGTLEVGAGECAGATIERLWSARRLRTYAAPADWRGTKAESAQGNPYRVDSRPMWRLDQIWPDDPLKVENYTPLVWSGLHWHASDQGSGGQPSARTADGGLELGVRMWWPDQLGSKLSSIAFVAPADGSYSVEGLVRTEVWEGGTQRPLLLQVLKLDRKETQITPVASIPLSRPRLLELHGLVLPLKAQQELIFIPQFPERGRVACTYLFEGLRITRLASQP